MLGVSERRIRLYIEMKRLPAVRAADVLIFPWRMSKTSSGKSLDARVKIRLLGAYLLARISNL